eukprot:NP_001293274.1 Nascent polypeptide-associated complex subunit alpha [Caenorhabditis elegans]
MTGSTETRQKEVKEPQVDVSDDSDNEAIRALKEADNDIVNAIMSLTM